MLYSYLLSSILTFSVTYSWFSFYGFEFFWKRTFLDDAFPPEVKPKYSIPVYMWEIYKHGVNSSEVDVVRRVFPKFCGASIKSRLYRNHRRKGFEFDVPKPKRHERLVKAEMRITTNEISNKSILFQVYTKTVRWVFLDEKKTSDNWVSLDVTSAAKNLGLVRFLILAIFEEESQSRFETLQPVLLLSYSTENESLHSREKRSLEDFEEETNSIWEDEKDFSSKNRLRSTCRRKRLYIKFSDIDYDSWIIAPEGYEAFQCVGKCTFPVSEHLSPTKHAILQTLLHNISPAKAPRACCVPTKLEPISVLYIDGNGILTYKFRYHDMVVAECGCR